MVTIVPIDVHKTLTDCGEEHVVEEEGDGDDEEDELAGLPGRVEPGADPRPRHVVCRHAHGAVGGLGVGVCV